MLSPQKAREILQSADLICSAETVHAALLRVAAEISRELADQNPLVLSVMGGAVVFSGQLLTLLDFPLDFDYLHVTRYGNATTGGSIHWLEDGVPDVRRVAAGDGASGSGWIGLRSNGAYRVTALEQSKLLPQWLALLLIVGALLLAWRLEGR